MSKPKQPQIFLSYAREDRAQVEVIYDRLTQSGFRAWMDVRDLLPGERWEPTVMTAVRESDFFLACITRHSANKRGFLQKEIRSGLEIWKEKLDGDIYLIPVRLEECEVPDTLRDFQWLDLFDEGTSWQRLFRALEVGTNRRTKGGLEPKSIPQIDSLNPTIGTEGPPINLNIDKPNEHKLVQVALERRNNLAILYTFSYMNRQLGEELIKTASDLITIGYKNFVIDLKGTKIVNSIGIGLIIDIIEKLLEIEGRIAFCHLTPTVFKAFHIFGVAQYAPIYVDENAAVVALTEGNQSPQTAEPPLNE